MRTRNQTPRKREKPRPIQCTICKHPDRARIELLRLGGVELGKIAEQFGASVDAKAVDAFHRWKADRIIAEVNNGGAMVENTIRMVDSSVPFKSVHASRGKVTRAEPIAALYEQGKVHHVGAFPQLEDQCCSFTSDFDRSRGGSPDRLDALVWAFTELMASKPISVAQIGHYTWS